MRSLLFVPGDDTRKLEKALGSGADALIVDLEDSVAADRKEIARETAAAFLAGAPHDGPRLYLRINDLGSGLAEDDLASGLAPTLAGVMLPKCCGGADVARLDRLLGPAEAQHGMVPGGLTILTVATENAASLFAMGSFAGSSQRLEGISWGAEDLSADLIAENNRDDEGRFTDPYRLARTLTLLGAVAAGALPIDAVFTDFRNLAGLRAAARAARRDGFLAKLAIHPAQVPVINTVFAPDPAALEEARAVVAAFAERPGAGTIGLNGRMIDRPHLLRARRLLDSAGEG
jgi:citrate lyase subunit beta/citryl-CoA lyase